MAKTDKEIVEDVWREIQDHISHEPMSLEQAIDFEKKQWVATLKAVREEEREKCDYERIVNPH